MNKTTSDSMCKLTPAALLLNASANDVEAALGQWRHSPVIEHSKIMSPFGIEINPECLLKPSHYGHFVALVVANVLIGTSSAPLYTLGTAYIDNHVSRENSSVYLAFIYSMLAFGPLVGYLAGAALLQLYVDTFSINSSELKIDPSDSNWVGGK